MSHKAFYIRLLVLGALSVAGLSEAQNGAKPGQELPAGAMQQKATTVCLECHDARIIVQQRLTKASWTKEVDKMVKWGAVLDANDRDALIDYLSTNFSQDRPAYEPLHTSQEKNGASKRP